ncbi:MAG: hypothetical protein IMF18_05660 [Proteobacteria bacterium]|nr:hypothetical protein [Pseudomonadota bacterium]
MIKSKNQLVEVISFICIFLLLFGCTLAAAQEKSAENRELGAEFITKFDKDMDGKVSESEFPGPSEHFQEFDKNNDGYIDKDEAPTKPPRRRRR